MASIPSTSSTEKPSSTASTRERILAAAAEVFAKQGLMAATTREIAQAAQVNEVTLFRQFRTKQNLLAAVIERVFAAAPSVEGKTDPEAKHDDPLRQMVWDYAQFYRSRLSRNVRLIRVLIGEIQHCDEQAQAVVRGVFYPQRLEFIERLRQAQERGLVRTDADPTFIADQLGGMILTSILKSDMPMPRGYSATRYLLSCVETIVRAFAESPGEREREKAR